MPSNNKLYQKYFEKTGIQLTDSPMSNDPSEVDRQSDELYHLCFNRPRKAIKRLEPLIKKYPNVPSLKNFLYVAFKGVKLNEKAEAILDRTLKEHPDYIFGITSKILDLIEEEDLLKHRHLLGSPPRITTITGPRTIHISEFCNYQLAVGHYAALTGDEAEAMERLQSLIDIGAEDKYTKNLAKKIGISRLRNFGQQQEKEAKIRQIVEANIKTTLTQTEEEPVFNHPEINIFYNKSVANIAKSDIAKIMELPRPSLIQDLETILQDVIRRRDYFFDERLYDDDSHEFIFHALYFLGALKSEKSLPLVLNLFRMGEDFIDGWFADYAEEVFYPVLYALGENQLTLLSDFVKEENNEAFNRLLPVKTVSQIALHQPERRTEVIEWLADIFQFHLDQPDNKNIIDTDFIGMTASYLIDIRAVKLLPLLEKIYANQWIPDSLQGSLKEMTKEIQLPFEAFRLDPLPLNIHEYYSKEYQSRKAKPSRFSTDFSDILDNETEAQKMVNSAWSDVLFGGLRNRGEDYDEYEDEYEEDGYYEQVKTVVRTSPKVGRNDACPCGSGKKYKKCCLKK